MGAQARRVAGTDWVAKGHGGDRKGKKRRRSHHL